MHHITHLKIELWSKFFFFDLNENIKNGSKQSGPDKNQEQYAQEKRKKKCQYLYDSYKHCPRKKKRAKWFTYSGLLFSDHGFYTIIHISFSYRFTDSIFFGLSNFRFFVIGCFSCFSGPGTNAYDLVIVLTECPFICRSTIKMPMIETSFRMYLEDLWIKNMFEQDSAGLNRSRQVWTCLKHAYAGN